MGLEVQVNRVFLKELAQIPSAQRKKIEIFVFDQIKDIDSLARIPNLRKLKGHKNYYRIRFGEYRAGVSFQNNILVFQRLLHRKDIYKYYP